MTVVAATAIVGAAAVVAPPFAAAKIESFDGKSWAGITLGVTTQDGIKKQFKNGRGEFSTSVEVLQEPDQPYRVSALYVNRDGNATLDGIAIKYRSENDGLPLEPLTAALGAGGKELHAPERYEDWKVIAYPDRGVMLFALKDKVPMVLLGHPGRIADTTTLLAERDVPVTEYQDPKRDEPKVLRFGNYSVDFRMRNDIEVDDRNRERREIEQDIRSAARGGGVLSYDPNATGTYQVTVEAKYERDKNKDGDGTVSVSINGQAPYGPVSSYASESFRIPKGGDRKKLEDTRYLRALDDAMRRAERDVEEKVRKQGPPSIESFRRGWWDKIIDKYRFHSQNGGASGEGGKAGGLL